MSESGKKEQPFSNASKYRALHIFIRYRLSVHPKQRSLTMKDKNKIQKIPFILIVFFLVLWMIGLAVGEPTRVLEQAKSICLACIGIG